VRIIHRFTLSIEVAHVSKAELRAYVKEAIECWGEQKYPDKPVSGLRGRVGVRHESKTRKLKPEAKP